MTNQTIDGVQRELLERLLGTGVSMNLAWVQELRALLDAPATCAHEWTDDGEFLLVCTACGAQQDYNQALQLAFELGGTDDGAYHLEADELVQVIQRYAEQPAPVAVVAVVALTQDAIDRIVPSLNPEPDRDEFHCEWALWSDRERIRGKLSTLLTANSAPVAVAPKSECPNCLGDAMFGCDACTPDTVAVEYKLHMGEALKVFDALKVERIARKVEQEDLGPMGATEIETWSTSIGVTLEMHTAMGGCTLIVRTATVSVVLPERRAVSPSSREQAMCANTWNTCLDEVTRLNTK